MLGQSRICRNHQWVDREYGREKWPAMLDRIREHDYALPQALHRVTVLPDETWQIVLNGYRVDVPASLADAAYRGWIARTVARHAVGVDAVVELGAGWGRNLFGCWLASGPSSTRYFAAEYTEAGREAASMLARRAPELRFQALDFDYHDPALDLPRFNKLVVFTAHSVEQIPTLPDTFVHFVRSLADQITVLHFEPVGWQITGGDGTYAVQNDYNRNLWPLLKKFDVDGLSAEVDVIGINPNNPTSLITWVY